ncbi:MAG: NAD(P)-dependent oxidoreductase [Thermoleophilaceae bacterium]
MSAAVPKRVAFLGLGIMGSRMAANLRRAGLEVVVWNRTRKHAEAFAVAHGATVADTPAEAACTADATITMVVDGPQVELVLFGDGGAAAGMKEGHLCVDMSTIRPSTARAIGDRLAAQDAAFVDAPVTGSKPKAEDGTLTIIAGGAVADIERAGPLFDAMGEIVVHAGPVGHGQATKVLSNTVTAINAGALAQAIVAARRLDVDPAALLKVMSTGSAASRMLELKGRPMLEHDFEPLFKLEHMLKDIRHCLEATGEQGAPFSLAETAEQLYGQAASEGPEGRDLAAVIEAAEREAGY